MNVARIDCFPAYFSERVTVAFEYDYGKRTQNYRTGPPGWRLSHRVHMGRARSVARRSGERKSEHRGHQRRQWRCADRRRVHLRLDGRAEGGKATQEQAADLMGLIFAFCMLMFERGH